MSRMRMYFGQTQVVPVNVRWDALAFLLLTLLAFLLRMARVGEHGVSIDEPFTIFYGQFPLGEMMERLKEDIHPPLFEIIVHLWMRLVGDGIIAMRLLPVMFGALTAGFIYLVGRELFSPRVGLMAGWLICFGEQQIFYSHETRGYTLLMLLAVASTWAMLRWWRSGHWGWWLGLLLLHIFMIYIHYFGILVLGVQGLWALASPGGPRRKVLWLAGSLVLITGAFLPFIVRVLGSASHVVEHHWVPPAGVKSLWQGAVKFTQSITMGVMAAITLLGSLVAYGVNRAKGRPVGKLAPALLLLLTFPITYLVFWVAGFNGIPIFTGRYVFFTSWALLLSWAGALVYLFKGTRWLPWAEAILLIGFAVSTNLHPNHQDSWPEVAEEMHAFTDQGGGVLLIPKWNKLGLAYHYDIEAFRDYRNLDKRLEAGGIFPYVAKREHHFDPAQWPRVVILRTGTFKTELDDSLQARMDADFVVDSVTKPHHAITYTWMSRKQSP